MSRSDAGALEVLVRRAVVALGQRRPLAGLALAGRRVAARHAADEGARLDLLLDERNRGADALVDGPGDLCLRRDREVAADVLEERPFGLREVLRIAREPLHRLLARLEHRPTVLDLLLRAHVRVDEVFDRAINGSRVLIHATLDQDGSLIQTK